MNLKPLNCFITCTKFKITTLKEMRETIWPGQLAVSPETRSAYCHFPIARRYYCFLCFRWRGRVTRSRPCLLVCLQPKDFQQNKKTHLALLQQDGHSPVSVPAKAGGKRVANLLQSWVSYWASTSVSSKPCRSSFTWDWHWTPRRWHFYCS